MHIALKQRSMHIAIKKLETSSPNEHILSNTFHGTISVRTEKKTMQKTPWVAPSPPFQPL
jgi:hypothetical protein